MRPLKNMLLIIRSFLSCDWSHSSKIRTGNVAQFNSKISNHSTVMPMLTVILSCSHILQRAQVVPPIVVLLAKVTLPLFLFYTELPLTMPWIQHPIIDKYDLSSIKEWACAAAPLGHDLIEAVENRTNIRVIEGYGMTETTCVISACRRETMKRGTVGQMIPNMLGKIIDGELLVKGPNIMKGYLRNSGADKATFTEDGWMKTGDLARFDDEGDLFIIDRVKEVSVAVCFVESNKSDTDRMRSSSNIRDRR